MSIKNKVGSHWNRTLLVLVDRALCEVLGGTLKLEEFYSGLKEYRLEDHSFVREHRRLHKDALRHFEKEFRAKATPNQILSFEVFWLDKKKIYGIKKK